MCRVVSEAEFKERITEVLTNYLLIGEVGVVTGPGRSGAIAAVYASHLLRVPFIPYGQRVPTHLGRLLIIDTATETGHTLRKAENKHGYANPISMAVYHEPPRVLFWYEVPKPQRYKHETRRNENE